MLCCASRAASDARAGGVPVDVVQWGKKRKGRLARYTCMHCTVCQQSDYTRAQHARAHTLPSNVREDSIDDSPTAEVKRLAVVHHWFVPVTRERVSIAVPGSTKECAGRCSIKPFSTCVSSCVRIQIDRHALLGCATKRSNTHTRTRTRTHARTHARTTMQYNTHTHTHTHTHTAHAHAHFARTPCKLG